MQPALQTSVQKTSLKSPMQLFCFYSFLIGNFSFPHLQFFLHFGVGSFSDEASCLPDSFLIVCVFSFLRLCIQLQLEKNRKQVFQQALPHPHRGRHNIAQHRAGRTAVLTGRRRDLLCGCDVRELQSLAGLTPAGRPTEPESSVQSETTCG